MADLLGDVVVVVVVADDSRLDFGDNGMVYGGNEESMQDGSFKL